MGKASSKEGLRALLAPVVAAAGLDLEDLDVTPAGRRRVLRVVIDRDGGVDLDHVADASRVVSEALDASDAMGATPYVLEVTSPGVDRPLVEQRHWRRATGRLVRAVLTDGGDLTGRVSSADEDGVVLDVDGRANHLPWERLRRGVVQVEFSRPGEGGDDADELDTHTEHGDENDRDENDRDENDGDENDGDEHDSDEHDSDERDGNTPATTDQREEAGHGHRHDGAAGAGA